MVVGVMQMKICCCCRGVSSAGFVLWKHASIWLAIAAAMLFAGSAAGADSISVPTLVDFGVVQSKSVARGTFDVTNTGKSAVVIRRVVASCGCTAAIADRTTIDPGRHATVHVELKLNAVSKGRVQKRVSVIFENEVAPAQVALVALVRDTVRVEPPVLNVDSTAAESLKITALDRKPFAIVASVPPLTGVGRAGSISTTHVVEFEHGDLLKARAAGGVEFVTTHPHAKSIKVDLKRPAGMTPAERHRRSVRSSKVIEVTPRRINFGAAPVAAKSAPRTLVVRQGSSLDRESIRVSVEDSRFDISIVDVRTVGADVEVDVTMWSDAPTPAREQFKVRVEIASCFHEIAGYVRFVEQEARVEPGVSTTGGELK